MLLLVIQWTSSPQAMSPVLLWMAILVMGMSSMLIIPATVLETHVSATLSVTHPAMKLPTPVLRL